MAGSRVVALCQGEPPVTPCVCVSERDDSLAHALLQRQESAPTCLLSLEAWAHEQSREPYRWAHPGGFLESFAPLLSRDQLAVDWAVPLQAGTFLPAVLRVWAVCPAQTQ